MGEAEQDSAIWLLCHFSHVVKLNLYQPFSLSLTHLFFLSSHFITYPPAIISLSPQLPTSSFPNASISLQRGTKHGRKALISPHRWSPQPPHLKAGGTMMLRGALLVYSCPKLSRVCSACALGALAGSACWLPALPRALPAPGSKLQGQLGRGKSVKGLNIL